MTMIDVTASPFLQGLVEAGRRVRGLGGSRYLARVDQDATKPRGHSPSRPRGLLFERTPSRGSC